MNTPTNSPRAGEDAHTPAFWKTRDARSARGFLISGHDGMTVATAKTAHDAALIVRAVNSHAALVAALENAVPHLFAGAVAGDEESNRALNQAREALYAARNP